MNKRSSEQWHQLFEAQKRSGLNQAQFCRKKGICPKHFSLRRKQLLSAQKQATNTSSKTEHQSDWITVQRQEFAPSNSVFIHHRDMEIYFDKIDSAALLHVIKALR